MVDALLGLVAGMLAVNGVPHFFKGITGQSHMTPFGQPSSALANVLWGWLNFVAAGVVWSYIDTNAYPTAYTAAALGALLVGAALAYYWSKNPEKNKK